eukprot:1764546-Rhodomonas_salina.3
MFSAAPAVRRLSHCQWQVPGRRRHSEAPSTCHSVFIRLPRRLGRVATRRERHSLRIRALGAAGAATVGLRAGESDSVGESR